MAESQFTISAVLSVGEANSSAATWDSSTAASTTVVLVNNDYSYNAIVVTLQQTTTITGGAVTFQGSLDGTNWFSMQGFSPGAFVGIGPTYALQASTYATFGFNLTAIPYFQIALTTAISGSGSVTVGYAADSFVNAVASAQAGTWNTNIQASGTPVTATGSSLNVNITGGSSSGVQYAQGTVNASPTGTVAMGINPSSVLNALNMDSSGYLLVNLAANSFGTVTVSGTVAATQSGTWTVQQGGAPWSVSQSGSWTVAVSGTVAATQSGTWNVGLNSGSNTIGSVTQASGPWTVNLTQVDGTALGAPTDYGTAPSGTTAVIGVNAYVTNSPAVTVSGTVAVTQSGSWTVTADQGGTWNIGTVTSITDAVTVAQPTAANLNATVTGTVAATQSTSPWVDNVTQWASTALGTPQTFGTAPTGVVVGTSSDLYVAGTRARSNQTTTAAGVVDVNVVGSLGATNSATNGTFVRITDNANAITAAISAYGTAPTGTEVMGVNAFVTNTVAENLTEIAGTAVSTAAAGVLKVGIVGNAGAVLDTPVASATQPANVLQLGGWVTSSAPAYANGTANTISLDTAGNIRVNVTNIVGLEVAQGGATAATNALQVAGVYNSTLPTLTSGEGGAIQLDDKGQQLIDLNYVGGSPAELAATGTLLVGIVGVIGHALDSTLAAGTAPTNGLAVIGQYNTAQPAPTNTQTVGMQIDQGANLLTFPGQQFKTGAAWSSSTAAGTFQYPTGTATAGGQDGSAAYLVQLDMTTTLTAGAVTFQGTYDNVNWVTMPTTCVLNPATFDQLANPYTFVASTNTPFLLLVGGYVGIRADLSTAITGTGTVTPYWSALGTSPLQFVREAKDQNRTYICFVVNNVASVTTEALMSMSINTAGTTTTATTYTVPTGKTLRLQSFSVACLQSNTRGSVRAVATGTVSATSSILAFLVTTGGSALQDFPDGLELPAGSELGITSVSSATGNYVTETLVGFLY